MVTEIRIYYEGDRALKPGFDAFLSNLRRLARDQRKRFQLISTGTDWRQYFSKAIKSHPASWNILLIDSEGPHSSNLAVDLCRENGWNRTHAESIFWMVEMMESWFHADKDALESYYGAAFRRRALAPNPFVEEIPKKDLMDGLNNATRNTRKGTYHKTEHAPRLLEFIDPAKVRQASPNCRKLFEALEHKLTTHANS